MSMNWANTDLLFRQVHPNHLEGKNPNSQAFLPSKAHQEKLSVDDASKVTAEQSWTHFTKNLGLQSAGTWAISFEEVKSCAEIQVLRDPILNEGEPSKNNPAHCLIDFSGLSSKGMKRNHAQRLAISASARGPRYLPAS